MVSLEELSALDLQIWLRSGSLAARAACCNQSTISRRVDRTLRSFALELRRASGEWYLRGDGELLALERELHQLARLFGHEPLRLEVSPLIIPLLGPAPSGWCLGRGDILGLRRPLQLLQERVIDAWLIDNTVDLPPADAPEIARFDLFRYPLWLAAADGHPLAGASALSLDDLRRFPVPQTPPTLFPNTGRHFAALGLSGPALRSRRYDPADWEGRTADGVSLTFGTPFNLAQHTHLRRLDSDPLLINGVALVVRRDCLEQQPILELRRALRQRLQQLQPRLHDLEALP
ncbi:MAG: LysR substrate-binding domain-containing protein [Synechococcaceae cyanobacterium]|nr:LysR substrate-binding domain-containing protein [Synechococcaceae cyanobacterium]